jgi:hypothetical protein
LRKVWWPGNDFRNAVFWMLNVGCYRETEVQL